MQKLLFSLLLTLSIIQAYSQTFPVTGSVESAQDNSALISARVILTRTSDQAVLNASTDVEGRFRFERVTPGQYALEINYLGFQKYTREVQVQNGPLNLGTLRMQVESTTLQEVQVIGRVPIGEQKGDTSQFNAKAFKTAPDASAEDLVTKMPGITIQNGTVQAQGEDVKQIFIDGKRYGGDDVNAAIRSLPADMIESVQVYDRQSDQAAFSGFDDGNRAKTLNFVTRRDRRVGQMGKISAGYGTDDRYMVGAALNIFNGERKITLTGLTNNINMFDFSVGETPGGGMRGRRGGWGGGSPNGIINTNTFGINYNDMWGKKMEVSGSYTYNDRDVLNNQTRIRQYTGGSSIGDLLDERSLNNNSDENHRFNFRLQYNINENNRLLISPNLSVQRNNSFVSRNSLTNNREGEQLSFNFNTNDSKNDNYNFSNNILYSHRFSKPGRVFTTNINTNYSSTDGYNFNDANTIDYINADNNAELHQYTDISRENFSWSGNASISERVGSNALLQLEYGISNQMNDSDRRTFDLEESTSTYSLLNRPLSNTFESNYISQSIGPSYQYRTDKTRFQVNARYQYATLESNNIYPEIYPLSRSFNNVLPSAELEYKFTQSRSLNINYRTNTNVPSVDQLQEVLDISNPLQLRIGNAGLDQDYQNRLFVRYRNFNPETNQVFFMGIFGTMTQNFITNAVYSDPAIIENYTEGYDDISRGARLSRTINMDGYWSVRSFFNYGQPINLISSNINFNGSVGYTRIPGMLDETINFANTTNMGAGLNLSSNISEKVDFNVSTNGNYNLVKNTAQVTRNNNYYTQNTNLRLNWILPLDFVYRTELNHQYNSGLSAGVDPSYILWNMSVGKKFLKSKQAELSLSVNDLLNQNTSIQRNITESYVEDVQATVLQRFFMVTFSYNLKRFSSGSAPEENDRGGFYPGGPGPRRN
ncbi:outer membrane beta-barrel protein [Pontibacter sp. SGAir0037]|uniref:outer membrane beta-barrel protein n=1 Tax=Pontibacter sp. SGAir0037 TaxID=2571030 RepID=UPI0010CD68D0|nr:outer membrane beta-barrel protein [Pontibacter sp. SGAir0037]QCR21870.1 hypothetical protein C1N53_05640 [Pontibacter sp. SGAir0037]